MSFIYDDRIGLIRDDQDEGVIADLAETVDPEDGRKMAAAPEMYDAVQAILYAHEIGELPLPASLLECAAQAKAKADGEPTNG